MEKRTTNWVDIEETEGDDTYLPPPEVIEDEKSGTKTVIEYRIEPSGQKVKVTSKFKVVTKTKKVSKNVRFPRYTNSLQIGDEILD
jgi:hypothetical protein